MNKRIFVFVLSSFCLMVSLWGQEATAKRAVKNAVMKSDEPALFQGLSLSVEVGTPLAKFLGSHTMGSEAALRINLKNHYFPTFELGYAKYEDTNDETALLYKTAAPYARIGMDINMLKDKTQANRLFVGLRLAYTTYKFDVSGPDVTDPVWGETQPFSYKGISSNRMWLEFVVGLEAEITRHFHMGWSLRYKSKLNEKVPVEATPYYIPGFGTGESSGFGASYTLTFDLSKKIKKTIVKP